MELHPARVIACQALVVGGLVTSSAWAEPPSPTPTSATLVGSTFATLIRTDPTPLRGHVSAAGVSIEAFELTPEWYRVTVEYEELNKKKVEGFESSDTHTCVLEFEFEANKLYRVVRSGIAEDGKLKRISNDNWGVWLIGEEWNQPLAQCL